MKMTPDDFKNPTPGPTSQKSRRKRSPPKDYISADIELEKTPDMYPQNEDPNFHSKT